MKDKNVEANIYDILDSYFVDKLDAVEVVIKSFHAELAKTLKGETITAFLIEHIKIELQNFSNILFQKLKSKIKLQAELTIDNSQLVINYPNLHEFLSQL